jgi:eukaryotic-like serine/threonine-protein kinase
MTLMDDPGKRFGRYEVLAELGRGAMGVVYKARDPKINRVVAVKTISMAGQAPEEEREYRERFFREAEAAGRVSHPGIVTIFDVGEAPETHVPYIVMEFVGGESLEKLLSRDDHKLPIETALQLALELAEALDCAHSQGVVHRDLKPANILMTEDGHAKIADFGVAKLNLANQTLAGRALGTPAYMSPEQLNGEPVDGRSDLFSLGVILYTVLTGYRPFQGNSALTVSFKVVNRDPIPATLLDTELPEGLDQIISKAMAKDPAERYQRGMDVVRDIQHLREARKTPKKPKPIILTAPANVSKTPKEEGQALTPVEPVVVAKSQSPVRTLLPAVGATRSPLEKFRRKSIIGVFVLAGLFIWGLWVVSFGPQGVRSRAAGPMPNSRTATSTPAITGAPPAEPDATPATPTVSDAIPRMPARSTPLPKGSMRASHNAPPIAKVVSKPIPPRQPTLPTVKVARAILPTVSPDAAPEDAPVVAPATLEIEVDHKFAEAHLSVWVDDDLSYTHVMEGTDKKRLVVFHRMQGHEFHAMQIAPGKHRLRVQVSSEAATYDQSATISGEFASGKENVLRITFNKHGDMNLALE